jgi:hypothetical protein
VAVVVANLPGELHSQVARLDLGELSPAVAIDYHHLRPVHRALRQYQPVVAPCGLGLRGFRIHRHLTARLPPQRHLYAAVLYFLPAITDVMAYRLAPGPMAFVKSGLLRICAPADRIIGNTSPTNRPAMGVRWPSRIPYRLMLLLLLLN